MGITREIVEDVAAELGINESSLVEKDYQVIQTLSVLAKVKCTYFELVFAGGTCLSKTFKSLQRMSEDVDIKITLTEQGKQLSKTELRRELGALKRKLINLFEKAGLTLQRSYAHNNNHFIELELSYTAIFNIIDTLRPNIKVELALCDFVYGREDKPLISMIHKIQGKPAEVKAFSCINVVHTAAEKLVALLRRTAESIRTSNGKTDETLIRHIYDLQIINTSISLEEQFITLVRKTVMTDGKHFQRKHPQFFNNPEQEIKSALIALNKNAIYKKQYKKFLGPLVYAKNKPTYSQCMHTLNAISKKVWGNHITPNPVILMERSD